jgi:putative acetyltransferase
MPQFTFSKIAEKDNFELAKVIKTVLIEQGNNKDGTVFTDDTTDRMFDGYQTENSDYFVVYKDSKLIGGCGIAQLPGETKAVCELQRLFLLKEFRGFGIGQRLIEMCINFAKSKNYKLIYLETFPNMKEALGLYKKNGFKNIENSMGNTGHFYCTTRMTLNL